MSTSPRLGGLGNAYTQERNEVALLLRRVHADAPAMGQKTSEGCFFAATYPSNCGVCSVSMLGIAIMVLDTFLVFGQLNP